MTPLNKIINAVCLFLAVISVSYVIYNKYFPTPLVDSRAKDYVQAEATIISKKVDKNGIQHTITEETNNVLPKNLIESEGLYDASFVDSLIAQTDIQKKEIISLTQINQSIIGKNLVAKVIIDSMKNKMFEYSDKNIYVSYTPDSTVGKFNYRYNQKLNIVQYNRKKWLLGQDHQFMDISSDDVNSTINGVRRLSVLSRPKSFGITLTAKSIYLPQTGDIGVGAQLRVRYKRMSAAGSNLYFPAVSKWIPVIGAEYDLLNY